MDYIPRYSVLPKSESSATIYTIPISYQHNFKAHWHNNMYSMQGLDPPHKQQLVQEGINKNNKNFSFSRMYSTKQSVNNNSNMPEKKTLWQSVFRSTTNLLGEHLTRGTNSFMKNWSNMNNPLSVTLVSPDFYKSMQHEKDQEMMNSDAFFVPKTWGKESPKGLETLSNVLNDNDIMSDCATKCNSDSSDSDRRWKEYKCIFVDMNKSQDKDSMKNEQNVNSVNNSDCKDDDLELHFNIVVMNDEKGLTLKEDKEPTMMYKPEEEAKAASNSSLKPASVTTMLTNAYNKMVDYLQSGLTGSEPKPRAESQLELDDSLDIISEGSESETEQQLLAKRVCSPKARPKRVYEVSSGRGRGRAKSQLRRSGVSQTRHRKERSRNSQAADIKCDMDSWEELEYRPEDVDECDCAAPRFGEREKSRFAVDFTFADLKLEREKPRKHSKSRGADRNNGPRGSRSQERPSFRPRLMSDSSVDSEDSYCIVFESSGCDDDYDFETDVNGYAEVAETETDDEEPDPVTDIDAGESAHRTKVRFNLMPVVHTMIQWNYAYRAARCGPWEQMARDRERFRARINSIGRDIERVLDKQHRMRVWHERFHDQNILRDFTKVRICKLQEDD